MSEVYGVLTRQTPGRIGPRQELLSYLSQKRNRRGLHSSFNAAVDLSYVPGRALGLLRRRLVVCT